MTFGGLTHMVEKLLVYHPSSIDLFMLLYFKLIILCGLLIQICEIKINKNNIKTTFYFMS